MDTYLAFDNILVFDTAWNHLEPVIQKLFEIFLLNVKLVYANEDYFSFNSDYIEHDQDKLLNKWHPDDFDEAAKVSHDIWKVDDFKLDHQLW